MNRIIALSIALLSGACDYVGSENHSAKSPYTSIGPLTPVDGGVAAPPDPSDWKDVPADTMFTPQQSLQACIDLCPGSVGSYKGITFYGASEECDCTCPDNPNYLETHIYSQTEAGELAAAWPSFLQYACK